VEGLGDLEALVVALLDHLAHDIDAARLQLAGRGLELGQCPHDRVTLPDPRDCGEGTQPREPAPGNRKIRQGTVVSAKPDKTITVQVQITRRHPTYEKVVRQSNTVHAHDERNEANEGDIVRVVESRPLSRLKRWRLLEIVERAR